MSLRVVTITEAFETTVISALPIVRWRKEAVVETVMWNRCVLHEVSLSVTDAICGPSWEGCSSEGSLLSLRLCAWRCTAARFMSRRDLNFARRQFE